MFLENNIEFANWYKRRAARRLVEIANGVEAVQDRRIHIEKVDGPFLFSAQGNPSNSKRLDKARDRTKVDRVA